MGHCEGLGSAEPNQQRIPNMHPVSTKYMNDGLYRAQIVGKY